MKFLFKMIILTILFLVSLLVFFPKIELYNFLEKELLKQNIIISNEIRKTKMFGLNIKGSEIYYDGINSAIIKDIDFLTYLVYTNINIKDVRVSKDFKNFIPSKIDNIKINHDITTFNKVTINALGEFGEFNADILFFERRIVGELKPSNIMKSKYKNLLREFKLVKGKYKYEFKF